MKQLQTIAKYIRLTCAIVFAITCLCGCVNLADTESVMNRYSVPDKEERKRNMLTYQNKTEMDTNDIANEIEYALEKYTNWDNLFLSDDFKAKFKNRKNIIGNTSKIENISCYSGKQYGLGDVVVVTVDYRKGLFEDETEATSTEFYYEYKIDSNNEIDDLILKDKKNIYTFNGEVVEDGP